MRPMTEENLKAAFAGESQAHMRYLIFAELQGEQGAVRSTHYALEAEKIHAGMYAEAKRKADAGADVEIGKVYICPVCGYTIEGEAPDKCPVCGARHETFKEF